MTGVLGPAATQALDLARSEASWMGHPQVHPAHLLLGTVLTRPMVNVADLNVLRALINRHTPPGFASGTPAEATTTERILADARGFASTGGQQVTLANLLSSLKHASDIVIDELHTTYPEVALRFNEVVVGAAETQAAVDAWAGPSLSSVVEGARLEAEFVQAPCVSVAHLVTGLLVRLCAIDSHVDLSDKVAKARDLATQDYVEDVGPDGDLFSERSQLVLAATHHLAMRLEDDVVGPEHMLKPLRQDLNAATLLSRVGVGYPMLRMALLRGSSKLNQAAVAAGQAHSATNQPACAASASELAAANFRMDRAARLALDAAIEEAINTGAEEAQPAHLLIGAITTAAPGLTASLSLYRHHVRGHLPTDAVTRARRVELSLGLDSVLHRSAELANGAEVGLVHLVSALQQTEDRLHETIRADRPALVTKLEQGLLETGRRSPFPIAQSRAGRGASSSVGTR